MGRNVVIYTLCIDREEINDAGEIHERNKDSGECHIHYYEI